MAADVDVDAMVRVTGEEEALTRVEENDEKEQGFNRISVKESFIYPFLTPKVLDTTWTAVMRRERFDANDFSELLRFERVKVLVCEFGASCPNFNFCGGGSVWYVGDVGWSCYGAMHCLPSCWCPSLR